MLNMLFNRRNKVNTPYAGVNKELASLGSSLRINGRRLCLKNRSCQVFGKYIDFWENGMKWLGIDLVADDRQMALLLHYWLELRLNSEEMEAKVPGLSFPESRKKIEEGEASFLDWYWNNLLQKKDRRFGTLIELFASHEKTRKLMSFTRLRDFVFSNRIPPVDRATPLPFVRITDNFEFEVHVNIGIVNDEGVAEPRRVIGKGNAKEMFELVLSSIPENMGRARYEWVEEEANPAA
jgi:hypothetical protein